jgi:hypothetical protein
VARSVAVAWLVAVLFAIGCLALTYRRNRTDMFGNKFILINSIWHVRIYVHSLMNPGIQYPNFGSHPLTYLAIIIHVSSFI